MAMVLSRLASALNSPMQVRKLGSSDLMVSEVCLGTMTWGVQNTDEEGAEQMDYYFNECGGNFFDTAEMYPVPTTAETQGRTDNCIRKWMQSRGIDRSKLVLATKVAGASDRITWLPGRNGEGSRVTKKEIITSVDESLKRLGTDYIDLLQIHWPDRYVPLFGTSGYNISEEREATSFEEQLEGMQEVIQAGKVRYIGVSNETPYGVMKFCQLADQLGLPRICSIQNSYSLLVRTEIEQGLSEVCSKRNENVGLLAYSPLAGGILSNKYTGDEESTKNSRLTLFPGFMDRYKQSLAVKAVAAYADIAKQLGMTPAEFALAWCYSRPEVTSSIIGATSVAQLKENMGALEHVSKITPDVIAQADEVFKVYRDPSKV
eukprot:CAMPEP_0113936858 /NCGR_PEP_ID=MMETSP1339-20121228/3626_1 /TAXON_ID=94617 /ORGANISM="Fibrocapsa japonica" /LENGTH=374 /DNA_ID=CAMNT_0000939427 /DNA_START=61 /DNA_END=1185 /DNA_ORIENTATION=- /assembly_acc=CAM_ASM_000762